MRYLLIICLLLAACTSNSQILHNYPNVGPNYTPQYINPVGRYDVRFENEPDLYKRKEMVKKDFLDETDRQNTWSRLFADSLRRELALARKEGADTAELKHYIQLAEESIASNEAEKAPFLLEIDQFYDELIKVQYETTAFYSLPDYKGEEYIVTQAKMKRSRLRFTVQSIRVAKGCKISIWPYEDFAEHPKYDRAVIKASMPRNVPVNVNTGSMVSNPYVLRATSWKLVCSQ